MKETRNIILIGRTGNGKSTIVNVISGTNKFKESQYVNSGTKEVQFEEVKIDGINYKIIDTVGIGDTDLTTRQVLIKLADASHILGNGLSQVLFVTSGKFTEEELSAFELLRTVIFDDDIVNYTTIVRTKFPGFRKPEDCEQDKKQMEGGRIKLYKNVIHVNNMTEAEEKSQESRKYSREILINLLKACQDVYKPRNLNELNERINSYMTEKEKLQKEIDDLRNQGLLNDIELRIQNLYDMTKKEKPKNEIDKLQSKEPLNDVKTLKRKLTISQIDLNGLIAKREKLINEIDELRDSGQLNDTVLKIYQTQIKSLDETIALEEAKWQDVELNEQTSYHMTENEKVTKEKDELQSKEQLNGVELTKNQEKIKSVEKEIALEGGQRQKVYKQKKLDELNEQTSGHMIETDKMQKEIDELHSDYMNEKEKMRLNDKELKKIQEKIKLLEERFALKMAQRQDIYEQKNIDELNERIGDYISKNKDMQKEIDDLRSKEQLNQEKIKRLEEEISSAVANQVEEKNPNFLNKVKNRCKIM